MNKRQSIHLHIHGDKTPDVETCELCRLSCWYSGCTGVCGNMITQFLDLLLGADIVGVNCHFDPMTCVEATRLMKEGVEKAGLKAHYMVQPLAYHTPDCSCQGFIDLPEFPFGNAHCSLFSVGNRE